MVKEKLTTVKKQLADLEAALLDAKIETALAVHRAKNIAAAKALICLSKLKLEAGAVPGLEEEILRIKKSQSYLFESHGNSAYVLLPVHLEESLTKSIADYIGKAEQNGDKPLKAGRK